MRKHEHTNGGGGGVDAPPLQAGDRLTRAEFLRIWEQHPEIKFAELIGGVVYMPSPLSRKHGVTDNRISGWLWVYQARTRGTEAGNNATTLLHADETAQPDDYLRILPEYGGQSSDAGKYVSGAAELVAEICVSSASYDLHQKKEVYQKAGVLEYLAILMHEQAIHWHRLTKKGYVLFDTPPDMIWKSKHFPGLWLNGKALFDNDDAALLATLEEGLRSPEHAAFVKKLARRKKN
jgi:Uma2 family endonuclease